MKARDKFLCHILSPPYLRTRTHAHLDDIIHTVGTVGPNAELSYPFKLVGLKLGRYNLVVGLGSDKVVLVTGEKEVRPGQIGSL